MEKKTEWWRFLLAVPAFLILSVIGGSVVLLFNAFMPYAGRYRSGDLGYLVLQIATGPVGVILANVVYTKIMQEKQIILQIVLNAIMATLFIGIVVLGLVSGMQFSKDALTVILAGATAIAAIVFLASAVKGGSGGQNT